MTMKKGVTKQGFGRVLRAGVRGVVVKQQGGNITIRLQYGNVYHGKLIDFVIDGVEGKD